MENGGNSSQANLNLPSHNEEEKILQEVMKMSALEYKKTTGQIDLSHLKRKQKHETKPKMIMNKDHASEINLDDSLTDQ
jgi:hypothetical protein